MEMTALSFCSSTSALRIDWLALDEPNNTPSGTIRARKLGIIAVLTGRDVPSEVPGIVYCRRGGVKLANPIEVPEPACEDTERVAKGPPGERRPFLPQIAWRGRGPPARRSCSICSGRFSGMG